jgi:hypothetical protein
MLSEAKHLCQPRYRPFASLLRNIEVVMLSAAKHLPHWSPQGSLIAPDGAKREDPSLRSG